MPSIRVANAPCSWGVLEFELEGKPQAFDSVLDEMAQAGYAGTELGDWEFMPTHSDRLKVELEKRNLAMLAAFVPIALSQPEALDRGIETAVRTAELLAAVADRPFLVLADDNGTVDLRVKQAGRIEPSMSLDTERWKIFAAGAETVARHVLEATEVRTVFHHHCAGYVETPSEIDTLLKLTDPELLGLCFDTGHYAYGGGDPLDGLRRHADRIWHVHFKDCHPDIAADARREACDYFEAVGRGVFCELGQGAVDFKTVLAELQGLGYEGWIVVEQDVLPGMGSPLQSAQRNRQFLKGLGL